MANTPTAKSFLTLTQDEMEEAVKLMEESENMSQALKEKTEVETRLRTDNDHLRESNADFTHKNAVLEQQVEVLRAQVGSGAGFQAQQQIRVEDGTVGSIPLLDAAYAPPKWVSETLDHLMTDETLPIVALTGPAGIGKTHGAEQWCARHKLRSVLFNCKGQDPFAFVESQELKDGQTIRKLGALAEAIQHANTVIILDEIDTSQSEFQSLLLGMLEIEPNRRKLTTQGNGVIPVAPGVRFILTMNNIGMNCGSRHRGTVLPPIQNRVSGCAGWIAVPMPDEKELSRILITKSAKLDAGVVQKIARTTLALIKLAAEGGIDCDVSIRTGLGVCKAFQRFGARHAWQLALLDGIDDPTQKAAAITAICTQFPGDFKPVG